MASHIGEEGRRSELLEAALQVFAVRGYHEARVSDIVAAAGVAQGTFYLYFKSKQQIYEALVESCTRALGAAVEHFRLLGEAAADDPITAMAAKFRLLLHTYRRQAHIIRLLLVQAPATPTRAAALVEGMRATMAEAIENSLRMAILQGRARPLDAAVVAQCVVGMLERIAGRWAVDPAAEQEAAAVTEAPAATPPPAAAATPAAAAPDIDQLALEMAGFLCLGLVPRARFPGLADGTKKR